ncbi:MAG: hypothetical protein ACKOKC_18110, partial [Chthoniobacterales bacterium]
MLQQPAHLFSQSPSVIPRNNVSDSETPRVLSHGRSLAHNGIGANSNRFDELVTEHFLQGWGQQGF